MMPARVSRKNIYRTLVASMVACFILSVAIPAHGSATFRDDAEAAGITFLHASELVDPQNFPETNGSGVCWGDVDGDGMEDVFFVNGLYQDDAMTAELDPRSALYLSSGLGTFLDVSETWNADLSGWGQGCGLVDYDGDGDVDLMVTGYDMLVLMANTGTTFEDVTAASGLTLEDKCDGNDFCFSEANTWADYDNDGDLDVYITQYGDYLLSMGGPVGPGMLNGMSNMLWRNNGNGTFTDVTDEAGVADDPGPSHSKSFQSSWADYDRDGLIDLYIASDTTANTMYRNQGDGTFAATSFEAGVADSGASMGLIFQDLNHDGLPDLYFTHYAHESNGYYTNNGDGTFTRRSGESPLDADVPFVGWGTSANDFDNDGTIDLLVVNGHTAPVTNHAQNMLLFSGNGDGTFTNVSEASGAAFSTPAVGRGSAVADVDLDGDLDFVVVDQFNNTARLVINDGPVGGFLQIELVGVGANWQSIGAEVTVTPAGLSPMMRVVQLGNNFLSQDSGIVHAGLGAATSADVSILWPDGVVQTWSGIAAGQRVTLTYGLPGFVADRISPWTELKMMGPTLAGGWFNDFVEVAVDSVDRAVGTPSGLASVEWDYGEGLGPYAGPVVFGDDGVYELSYRATDLAGNVEPMRRSSIGIDRSPPTVHVDITGFVSSAGWHPNGATVRVVAEDPLAGVHQKWLRVNGGDWQVVDRVHLNNSGVYMVEYYATDRASNAADVQQVVVRVDREKPSAAFASDLEMVGIAPHEVFVDASDKMSGIARVAFFRGDASVPFHVDSDGSDGYSVVLAGPDAFVVRAVAHDYADHYADVERLTVVVGVPSVPLSQGLPTLWVLPLLGAIAHLRRRPL